MVTFAAGGLLRRADGRICLVHRPRYDDWSIPKGKLTFGETLVEAAVREVKEETQCRVECGRFAGRYDYLVDGEPKRVFVWHMSLVESRPFEPNDEIDSYAWHTPKSSLSRLSYNSERDLVRRVFEFDE